MKDDQTQEEPKRKMNGEQLVAYWEQEGIVGSRSEIADSSKHAREIRGAVESDRRKLTRE